MCSSRCPRRCSPGDETYAKLDFYAAMGVREALVAHPGTRTVELFRLTGDRLLPVTRDAEGAVRCDVLGGRLFTDGAAPLQGPGASSRVAGGRGFLQLSWADGSATV